MVKVIWRVKMYIILLILGVICLGYFLCIALWVGHGTNFYFIWLLLGLVAIIQAVLLKKGIWAAHMPVWFRKIFLGLVCLGCVVFLVVEGCIISGFSQKGPQEIGRAHV